jgi:hypothetical protein
MMPQAIVKVMDRPAPRAAVLENLSYQLMGRILGSLLCLSLLAIG